MELNVYHFDNEQDKIYSHMKKTRKVVKRTRLIRLTNEQDAKLTEWSKTLFKVPVSVQKTIVYLLFERNGR